MNEKTPEASMEPFATAESWQRHITGLIRNGSFCLATIRMLRDRTSQGNVSRRQVFEMFKADGMPLRDCHLVSGLTEAETAVPQSGFKRPLIA